VWCRKSETVSLEKGITISRKVLAEIIAMLDNIQTIVYEDEASKLEEVETMVEYLKSLVSLNRDM
jgi:hypothetical protein